MERAAISDTALLHEQEVEPCDESGYESLVNKTPEGNKSLTILVDGVTCALCIQAIENGLSKEADVSKVHLNFGARRLHIEWDGEGRRANDFVRIVEKLGYGIRPYDEQSAQESTRAEERFLLLCLGVAGFAMGNVMLLSVGVWSTSAETMGMATRDFLHLISAMIALPAVMFSGRPFFKSAFAALKGGRTNMDVPISLALILSCGASLLEIVHHGEHVYFDSAIMLTFFLLIGRYLDFKARDHARSSAHDLLKSFQGFASVIEGTQIRRLLIRDLKEGMMVRVAVGEKFPVDGVVHEGKGSIDTALVTGETMPRDIHVGDNVYAGTVNLSAPLVMEVTQAADHSLLSDIAALMDQAGQSSAAYVRLADKAAQLYTPVVHSMALLTFLGWIFMGQAEWQDALLTAITVLIITCPCALGLAVPVVQVLATGKLMKRGVFVKSGDALERLATIDTAIFDKTGTLTVGIPALVGEYNPEHLKQAASLAVHSAHPLSKALVATYSGDLYEIKNIKEHKGQGLSAVYGGHNIQIGSRSFCGNLDAAPTDSPEIWLRDGDKNPVQFCFEDKLREDAGEVAQQMKQNDISLTVLSGDREIVVQKMAAQVGIQNVYGEQNPVDKFRFVEGLQAGEHKVLMVGDGLNDAPVLAQADISIAPGTAIDLAQNAADIVFMGDKFAPVYETYRTARKTCILIQQNFALAVLYNLIAIPLAVMGFVTPFIAALAMSGSSLLVIANSFRLK